MNFGGILKNDFDKILTLYNVYEISSCSITGADYAPLEGWKFFDDSGTVTEAYYVTLTDDSDTIYYWNSKVCSTLKCKKIFSFQIPRAAGDGLAEVLTDKCADDDCEK